MDSEASTSVDVAVANDAPSTVTSPEAQSSTPSTLKNSGASQMLATGSDDSDDEDRDTLAIAIDDGRNDNVLRIKSEDDEGEDHEEMHVKYDVDDAGSLLG